VGHPLAGLQAGGDAGRRLFRRGLLKLFKARALGVLQPRRLKEAALTVALTMVLVVALTLPFLLGNPGAAAAAADPLEPGPTGACRRRCRGRGGGIWCGPPGSPATGR
jgi:hypothetical protein